MTCFAKKLTLKKCANLKSDLSSSTFSTYKVNDGNLSYFFTCLYSLLLFIYSFKQSIHIIVKYSGKNMKKYLSHFFFLGLHPPHMEVPRLGVESDLWLPAYTTVTAMWGLSHICDLHHSSPQHHQILNPLSRVGIKPTSSWILFGFITAEPQWVLLLLSISM